MEYIKGKGRKLQARRTCKHVRKGGIARRPAGAPFVERRTISCAKPRSEIDSQRNLAGPSASELATPHAGDAAEAVVGDIELRIAQVHPIGHVGEGAFEFETRVFGQRETLG